MSDGEVIPQTAALCYRELDSGGTSVRGGRAAKGAGVGAGGPIEVLLITSRSGNWSIPKGLIDPGRSAREMAAIEALEEAGVIGEVGAASIGTFTYEKWGSTCRVEVYPLLVDRVLDKWLEDEFRERLWLPADEAADTVARDEVARIIGSFAGGKEARE